MRLLASSVATVLLLGACGEATEDRSDEGSDAEAKDFSQSFGDAEVYPVFVSSELTVGSNRFIIGLLDSNDAPVNDPEIEVSVDFYELSESNAQPVATSEFDFVESVPGQRGVYVGNVDFSAPGEWGAEVSLAGGGVDEELRGSFEVRQSSSTPALGADVPASDTLTADDAKKLSDISTDTKPDPSFYELSIADALEAGEPFVVAFATPKFCASATCGPTLDIVKEAAADFPEFNYLHVEPYTNLDDPNNLQPIEATREWGLPSEPWVFVVDGEGKLVAKYEGVLSADELRAELSKLT
ncbi:MAG: hypothetical protein ACRDK3_18060 [Actinomycetota bacterium]